jgi:alkylated DNA repair dioxygenase AlkB
MQQSLVKSSYDNTPIQLVMPDANNEPELGPQPVMTSLSLGEVHNFDFFHQNIKGKVKLSLDRASLLVMNGDTESYWQHNEAKDVANMKKTLPARIKLTFRYRHKTGHS